MSRSEHALTICFFGQEHSMYGREAKLTATSLLCGAIPCAQGHKGSTHPKVKVQKGSVCLCCTVIVTISDIVSGTVVVVHYGSLCAGRGSSARH